MNCIISFKSRFTLVLIMAVCLSGCKKESDNPDGEYEVVYYWTPAGSGTQAGPMVVTYKFHCMENDPDLDCDFLYFENESNTSGNWMSMPKEGSACSDFVAVVKQEDGTEYTFLGQLLDPLKEGGLRVHGNYEIITVGGAYEVGTFTATSDLIKGGTDPCRPD